MPRTSCPMVGTRFDSRDNGDCRAGRALMFRLGIDLRVLLHRGPIDFRAGIGSELTRPIIVIMVRSQSKGLVAIGPKSATFGISPERCSGHSNGWSTAKPARCATCACRPEPSFE